jgi:hypothetical protein
LLLAFDSAELNERLTAWGGLLVVVEMYCSLGVKAAVERHVKVKERQRGEGEADIVENFLLLLASGGECMDDFANLRSDPGLVEMLGRELCTPDHSRKFLYRFHDEDIAGKRPQTQQAWVPEETSGLQGLDMANAVAVREFQRRKPELTEFTVDMDASIIESHKREALAHYDGGRGYQPEIAIWAETLMVLSDKFRDGNVPAGMDPLTVVKRAFAVLLAIELARIKRFVAARARVWLKPPEVLARTCRYATNRREVPGSEHEISEGPYPRGFPRGKSAHHKDRMSRRTWISRQSTEMRLLRGTVDLCCAGTAGSGTVDSH